MLMHNQSRQYPKGRLWAKVLSAVLLFTFIVLCGLLAVNLYQTYTVRKTHQKLKSSKNATEIENDWSNGMLDKNEDYKGWLTIYGTGVDHPVVQGKDNDEYVRLAFDKTWNIAGTPFIDENCKVPNGGNLIIYGHMMKDNTMFGSLKQYKDVRFFKDHTAALWEDEAGQHYYSLFAAMVVPGSASVKGFIDLRQFCGDLNEEETEEMIELIKERSFIYKSPEIIQGSKTHLQSDYLFVVTCDYSLKNGRLVLVFRNISDT